MRMSTSCLKAVSELGQLLTHLYIWRASALNQRVHFTSSTDPLISRFVNGFCSGRF